MPEPGATLSGKAGNDYIRGGPGDDQINGGDGDDVLIGRAGNDDLTSDQGYNQYLPGEGENTIKGGSGLDVVYIKDDKASVSGLGSCKSENCELTYVENGTSSSVKASDVEVIIFTDGRHDVTK